MHQPRPHGRFTYGVDLSPEDEGAAELLVRRLTNLKEASGVSSLKMVRSLPSGAMAIAMDAGGVLRLLIQPVREEKPIESDGLATDYIPMLFSGEISKGALRQDEGVTIRLTEQTRKRLIAYSEKEELPPGKVELQRFVIQHGDRFGELRPKVENSTLIWTQYHNQRPTWYSGSLASAVQVVGGYGRQRLAELPDDKIERARMLIPAEVMRDIKEEMKQNVRLPGYTGLPPESGQYRYEYKFEGTNGVSYDALGKPWLIQVGNRGVFAMPMPLVPATTTRAFHDYVRDKGDSELEWVVNRFGGLPSGESFPVGADAFESWRRAGVVVKVCDTSDFYDHFAYSSACGWSFNLTGREAFNTCYDYDQNGVGVGYAFMLALAMGAAVNGGRLPKSFHLDDPDDQRKLDQYLSSLYQVMRENSPKHLAIKYKLRRADPDALLARHGARPEAEVEYWDALEMEPIAEHKGLMTLVGRGPLFSNAPFKHQPQIKFPEPMLDGCVSFDFLPNKPGAVPEGMIVLCDTIMYGYYIGDQLRVAKYFLDQTQFVMETKSDFEDCMAVGSWTQTMTAGIASLQGNFYTSDFDEREAAAPVTETMRVRGDDLGYDSKPFFAFDSFFARPGTLWRNRYFKRTIDIDRTEGFSKTLALCIPFLTRGAILHAKKTLVTKTSKSHSVDRGSVRDPYTYRYWTNDFVHAWLGGLSKMDGRPYPLDGNPVWVEIEEYNPGGCSDFADQGPWISGLPADYTWLIHPSRHEWLNSGGGGPPPVQSVSEAEGGGAKTTTQLDISILDFPDLVGVGDQDSYKGYFDASPNDFGDIFYRDAVSNMAGESVYASVSEQGIAPGLRKSWGVTQLADHKSAHHFIGVINE